MRPDHYALLYAFIEWAGEQPHIAGIAIAGPCANDENEEDTDISFIIISDKKTKTTDAILQQFQYDKVEQATKEERGLFTSLRIGYTSGIEAEFGIVNEAWLKEPLEPTVIDVIMNGFKVIWEREDLFGPISQFIVNQTGVE